MSHRPLYFVTRFSQANNLKIVIHRDSQCPTLRVTLCNSELTRLEFRRTLACMMPAVIYGFHRVATYSAVDSGQRWKLYMARSINIVEGIAK
jgi:hypothetical protein